MEQLLGATKQLHNLFSTIKINYTNTRDKAKKTPYRQKGGRKQEHSRRKTRTTCTQWREKDKRRGRISSRTKIQIQNIWKEAMTAWEDRKAPW